MPSGCTYLTWPYVSKCVRCFTLKGCGAGVVPHEPELLQLADGEVLVRRTYPCSGVDIKSVKNTDLSYGPWADRQRQVAIVCERDGMGVNV